MKHKLITILTCLFPLLSFSQKVHDQTKIVVDYIFTLPSSDMKEAGKTEVNTELLVGNSTSLFRATSKPSAKQYKVDQGNGSNSLNYKSTTPNIQQYLRNYDFKKKDFVSGVLVKPYYWEQDKPTSKWEILKDKQVLLGYNCTKAKMFSDRLQKYFIAWFTPELPFTTGPSNAGGLPGLILKFESEDKVMSWVATKVSKPNEMNSLVWFDKDAQKTTKSEFDKAMEAYRKDPQLIINQMNLKGKVSGIKIE